MTSVVAWFELPAKDVDRATGFYAGVLGAKFQRMPEVPGSAFFDHETDGPSGEISLGEPASAGTLIYLVAPRGVGDAVSRVEAAGGKVLTPKTSIGSHGWIAVIQDTEGNRVGLHNMDG